MNLKINHLKKNVYREAFVFKCAMADRKFYLPGTGEMAK